MKSTWAKGPRACTPTTRGMGPRQAGKKVQQSMKPLWMTAAMVLLCLAGCETTPFQKSSDDPPVELLDDNKGAETALSDPGLAPALARRFKAVPIPQGLREDRERSFVYDSKSTQVARMVYNSKHGLAELARFYLKYAPEEGWTLVSTTQVDESVSLLFTKPGRRLEVSASRQGVGRSNKLVILYLPEESPA